jgi:hypothetical protein
MESKIKLANYTLQFPFILFYQGNYLEAPTINLIAIVEQHFKSSIKKSNLKTVIYTLIEALQNIERYSAHAISSEDFALIYQDHKHLNIYTYNTIKNDKIVNLKKTLENITVKNKDELRDKFMEVLASDTKTEKGAGLGLIDLARKSENNLSYSFETISDEYSGYLLSFSLALDNEIAEKNENINDPSDIIKTLKESFKLNKSSLYYAGSFSVNFIQSLIDMLKVVKKDEATSVNTKTHHILIELNQNVKKHSYKLNDTIKGQLFIEWKNNGLEVSTYNLIENKKNEKCISKIEMLNASNDLNELKEIGKKQLSNLDANDGLGLIDVATLIYPEKIKYLSVKKNEEIYELIITSRINYESNNI